MLHLFQLTCQKILQFCSIKIEFSVRLLVYISLSILYICSLAFQITYKVFHFRLPIIDIFLHTLVSLFGFGLQTTFATLTFLLTIPQFSKIKQLINSSPIFDEEDLCFFLSIFYLDPRFRCFLIPEADMHLVTRFQIIILDFFNSIAHIDFRVNLFQLLIMYFIELIQ